MSDRNQCLQKLLDVFRRGVDTPQDDYHLITHYTKYDTGLKILGSKTLWATDHQYLNDPLEIQYGLKKILGLLERNGQVIPNVDTIKDILKDRYDKNHYNMLITSLVKHDDYLPCWRYYGGNGSGISISFNKDTLADSFKQRGIGPMMSDIVYSDNHQNQLIENLFNCYTEGGYDYPECLVIVLFLSLPTFKHPDWQDELEFRIISPHIYMKQDEKFIFKDLPKNKVVPKTPRLQYKLFEFEYIDIEKVTIGPCGNYHLARKRIISEILKSGLSEVPFEIIKSEKKYFP